MASNTETTAEQESEDLTTCCVCFEVYNEGDRKPKFISCHHTYCLGCIKKMARNMNHVACPKCKAVCILPGEGPEALSTNVYVLNNIQLKNLVTNQHCWCLDCKAIPKVTCEGRHSILDRMEDVDEIEGLGAVVTVTFSQAIERRQQIKSHLQTLLAGNDECIEKLRSLVDSNQLSARKSGTASAKKRLEEILQESEKEVKDADRLWDGLKSGIKSTDLFELDAEKIIDGHITKKRKLSATADGYEGTSSDDVLKSFYNFPSTRISANRLCSPRPLQCRNFVDHHQGSCDGDEGVGVRIVEFSDDSSFFVSGGYDGRILLWPTNKAIDVKWTPKPTAMDTSLTEDENIVYCLAVSPDNGRILSGGTNGNLFIHDVNTKKLLNSLEHPFVTTVLGCALQPGSEGNVLATASADGILRLFDIRRNKNAVSQSDKRNKRLHSVMFSPAQATAIAVASASDGSIIYDIRNLKSCLYSFPCASGSSTSATFNGSGTRLLCLERRDRKTARSLNKVVVYDLSTRIRPSHAPGKVLLLDPDFRTEDMGWNACCYAGLEDDLVIAGSANGDLFVWSLPDENAFVIDCTINRSFHVLRNGHGDFIRSIRCSNDKSAIVSCAEDGVIKLWTSGSF